MLPLTGAAGWALPAVSQATQDRVGDVWAERVSAGGSACKRGAESQAEEEGVSMLITLMLAGACLAGVRDAWRDPVARIEMWVIASLVGGTLAGVIGLAYLMQHASVVYAAWYASQVAVIEGPGLVLAATMVIVVRYGIRRRHQMQEKGR